MGQPVFTASQITQWVRTEFTGIYNRTYDTYKDWLAPVMEQDLPSTRSTEFYGYYLASPHMKVWRRGEMASFKGFGSVSFSVENKDWVIGCDWHENDERFDQTKSLVDNARKSGARAAMLDYRVFLQIITDVVDVDLLAAIPLAPDGAALYANTAGGVARFGATNGNLLGGAGIATPTAIRTDFWTATEQFRLFQDGEGQELLTAAELDAGYTVIYGAANDLVFREAFVQGITQGSTGNTNAVTNIIHDSGVKVTLRPTQKIADNDWFVFANGVYPRPVFSQAAYPLRETPFDFSNSDQARKTKVKSMMWDQTKGYGVALPIGTIKINN